MGIGVNYGSPQASGGAVMERAGSESAQPDSSQASVSVFV